MSEPNKPNKSKPANWFASITPELLAAAARPEGWTQGMSRFDFLSGPPYPTQRSN
jgi:hypothetical protein